MRCTVRSLIIVLISGLLAACQSASHTVAISATDAEAQFSRLDGHLAAKRLEKAQTLWLQLRDQTSDAARIDHYRHRLVEAFMQQGEDAIDRGDMRVAIRALNHARALMPAGPALTNGLACTINCIRNPAK